MRGAVAFALVLVFASLSLLHVFWAFGGRWGASGAVPEVNGQPAFRPGPFATLAVASLLGAAATVIALRVSAWPGPGAVHTLARLGTWTLSAVFALRAVGNFDSFGFFKVARDTAFARNDTLFYSPLCVAISLGCLVIALSR